MRTYDKFEAERAIAVAPRVETPMHDAFAAAVKAAGGRVAPLEEASAIIWADPTDSSSYPEVIASAPNAKWVQLPYAGIEDFAEHLDSGRVWTCGKGVYAEPVAEHVMAALLMAFRNLHVYARATSWSAKEGRNLLGADIVVLGGGGIARSLTRLLEPWGCGVTVLRRSPAPFEGAARTLTLSRANEAVAGADAVVVALSLTEETRHAVDAGLLDAMAPEAWLVNVGRGGHVDHEALADALRTGSIAGAVLDVTDPEPLPDSSELWHLPNCVVTPHTGNTPEMGLPLIARRVRENAARWIAGEELKGLVDVSLGY